MEATPSIHLSCLPNFVAVGLTGKIYGTSALRIFSTNYFALIFQNQIDATQLLLPKTEPPHAVSDALTVLEVIEWFKILKARKG